MTGEVLVYAVEEKVGNIETCCGFDGVFTVIDSVLMHRGSCDI